MSQETIVFKSEDSQRTNHPSSSGDMSTLDQQVLSTLHKVGPTTRGTLAKKTGIARSTLYDSLLRLSLRGLVKKYPDRSHNSRGRPKVYFEAV